MKILLLSSNNGQGHNSAAKAIMEEAERRGIASVMIDALIFDSPHTSEVIKKIHVKSALHAPRLFATGNRIAGRMSRSERPSSVYQKTAQWSDRVLDFIEDNGFDTVIATQIFAAETLSHLEKKLASALNTYFVVTDYSYTPFTPETCLDAYFLPHAGLIPVYEEKAPGKKYVATGIPVSKKKLQSIGKQEARRVLDIPPEVPVVVIMLGSMGFGDAQPILAYLMENAPDDTHFYTLCGTNHKLKRTLEKQLEVRIG